jgi:hypothetical protein
MGGIKKMKIRVHFGVFFIGEISPGGKKKFKNANFGDLFSKTHFLIAKFFIQFDIFSSI